jgi:hypothetical protein
MIEGGGEGGIYGEKKIYREDRERDGFTPAVNTRRITTFWCIPPQQVFFTRFIQLAGCEEIGVRLQIRTHAYLAKFENVTRHVYWGQEKLFDGEKKTKTKFSWHCPFKRGCFFVRPGCLCASGGSAGWLSFSPHQRRYVHTVCTTHRPALNCTSCSKCMYKYSRSTL